MTKGRMSIASCITKDTNTNKQTNTHTNTHRLCNSYDYSTVITVARTCLNGTLHIHCFSCLIFSLYCLIIRDNQILITTALLITTARRVLRLRMKELSPIWRVAANKLNKQSRTADEGWFSSLGVG